MSADVAREQVREDAMKLLVDHGVWQDLGTVRSSYLATAIGNLADGIREQTYRDVEHAMRSNALAWEADGSDPRRVRVTLDWATTVESWADDKASPDGPASGWRAHLTTLADEATP